MMPPVSSELAGWWDEELHVTYTPAEAEGKFGARIYRTNRPAHLKPLFINPKEISNLYGSPSKDDEWIGKQRWDHAPELAMVMRCRKVER